MTHAVAKRVPSPRFRSTLAFQVKILKNKKKKNSTYKVTTGMKNSLKFASGSKSLGIERSNGRNY